MAPIFKHHRVDHLGLGAALVALNGDDIGRIGNGQGLFIVVIAQKVKLPLARGALNVQHRIDVTLDLVDKVFDGDGPVPDHRQTKPFVVERFGRCAKRGVVHVAGQISHAPLGVGDAAVDHIGRVGISLDAGISAAQPARCDAAGISDSKSPRLEVVAVAQVALAQHKTHHPAKGRDHGAESRQKITVLPLVVVAEFDVDISGNTALFGLAAVKIGQINVDLFGGRKIAVPHLVVIGLHPHNGIDRPVARDHVYAKKVPVPGGILYAIALTAHASPPPPAVGTWHHRCARASRSRCRF